MHAMAHSGFRVEALLQKFFGGERSCLPYFFFFSSRRRHTRFDCDWSSDVCSSDLVYVTTDFGKTFTAISHNLPTGGPDYVHVVREDPFNRNLLYVGTDVGAYVRSEERRVGKGV